MTNGSTPATSYEARAIDGLQPERIPIELIGMRSGLVYWRMPFSENRLPLFRGMRTLPAVDVSMPQPT
jgi:hypothetical protein